MSVSPSCCVPRSLIHGARRMAGCSDAPVDSILGVTSRILDVVPGVTGGVLDVVGALADLVTGVVEVVLRGLDVLLSQETGLPIHVDEDPLTCVVRGTGKILDDEEKYWSVLTT